MAFIAGSVLNYTLVVRLFPADWSWPTGGTLLWKIHDWIYGRMTNIWSKSR
ncbi:hypothetical protein GNT69_21330 [Bacillus sp. B15-48]|nr:hypothetical protein [Bacillus sp. B15-48]